MVSVHATAYPVRLAYAQIVREPIKALDGYGRSCVYACGGACTFCRAGEHAGMMEERRDYECWTWHLMNLHGFEC